MCIAKIAHEGTPMFVKTMYWRSETRPKMPDDRSSPVIEKEMRAGPRSLANSHRLVYLIPKKFHICDCLLCAQLRCAIQWAFCRKKTTTTTRSRRNNGNSVCLDRMLLWSFWLRRYRQQRVQLGCVLWLLWTFGMYNLVCWVDEMCAQWFASQIFIHTAQHKYTRTQQPDQRIETERNIVIIIYLLMAIHFKPSEEKKKKLLLSICMLYSLFRRSYARMRTFRCLLDHIVCARMCVWESSVFCWLVFHMRPMVIFIWPPSSCANVSYIFSVFNGFFVETHSTAKSAFIWFGGMYQ